MSTNSKAYQTAYRESHREEFRGYSKKWREKQKAEGYKLYYLPEHHYVGYTSNLTHRLSYHRTQYGRITEGVEVIAFFKDKKEAMLYERLLHEMGYAGKNSRYISKTVGQVLEEIKNYKNGK